ncbi:MAG TPA: hypothetical protein VJC03_05460 [bacterium]|nr:hypothetical protein [bacterium]
MKGLGKLCIWLGMASAILGGISRIVLLPLVVPSRVWAGMAVIFLLISIAVSVLPENKTQ